MLWLSMYHDSIIIFRDLLTAVPHFFYKRAGSIVLLGRDTPAVELFFNFERSAKCRNDGNVFSCQFLEWYQLLSGGILQKANTALLQVFVNLWIVDHFT